MSKVLSNQLRILRQQRSAFAKGDMEEYNRLTGRLPEEEAEAEAGLEDTPLEEELEDLPLEGPLEEEKPLVPRTDWSEMAPGEIPGGDSPSFQDIQKLRNPESSMGMGWARWRDFARESSREGAERSATPVSEMRGSLAINQVENAAIGGFIASKLHPVLAVPTLIATAFAALAPTVAGVADAALGTDASSRPSGFGGDPLDPTQWLFGSVFPSWTAQTLQNDLDAEIVKYYKEGSKESIAAQQRLDHAAEVDTLIAVVQDNFEGQIAAGQLHDEANAEHYLESARKNENPAHQARAIKTATALNEMDEALESEFDLTDIPPISMFSDLFGRGPKSGVNLSKARRHLHSSVLKRLVADNPGIAHEEAQKLTREEVKGRMEMALQSHPFLQSTSIIRLDTEEDLENIMGTGKRWRKSLTPYGLGDVGEFFGDTFAPFKAILTAPSLLSKDGLIAPEQIATESILASGTRLFNLAPTTLWAAGAKFDKMPVLGPTYAALGLIPKEDSVLDAEGYEWLMMGSDATDASLPFTASVVDHLYPDGLPGSQAWNEGYAGMVKAHPFLAQFPVLIPTFLMEPDAMSLAMGPLATVGKSAVHSSRSIKWSAHISALEEAVESINGLKGILDPFLTEVDGVKVYKDITPEAQAAHKEAIQVAVNKVLNSSEDPEIQDFLITNIQTRLNAASAREVSKLWNEAREARRALHLMKDDTGELFDAQELLGAELRALELEMKSQGGMMEITDSRLRLVVEAVRKSLPQYFDENGLTVRKVKRLKRADLQKVIEDATRDMQTAVRDLEGLLVRNGDAFADEAKMFEALQAQKKLLQQAHSIAKKGLATGDEVSILSKEPGLEAGKFLRYDDVDGVKQAIVRVARDDDFEDMAFPPELIVFNREAVLRRLNPAYGKATSAAGSEFRAAVKGVFFRGEQGSHTAADGSSWRGGDRALREGQVVRWVRGGESMAVDELKVVEEVSRKDGTTWVEIQPKVGTPVIVPREEVYTLMARDVEDHLDTTIALLEARARAATIHLGEEVTEEAMNAWYKRNFYGVRAEGEATQRLFEGKGPLPVIDELSPYGIQKNRWRINQRLKNAKKLDLRVADLLDKAEADMVARLGRALTDEEDFALYARTVGPHELAKKQAEIAEARQYLASATSKGQKKTWSDVVNKLLAEEKKLQDDFIDALGEKEAKSVLTDGVDRANKAIDLDIEKRSEWRGIPEKTNATWTQIERFAKEYAGGRIPKDDPEALQFLANYGRQVEEATAALKKTGDDAAAQGDLFDDIMYQGPATAGATTAEEAVEAARLWKELGTESPYFKKWFGDSKMVGEDGKPLTLYHGGAQGVTTLLPAGGPGAPKGSAMGAGVQSVGRAIYTSMDGQEARRHASMTAGQQLRARTGVWGNSPVRGQTGMPDNRNLGLYKMYARLESPLDLRKSMVDSPQDVKNLRAILQEVRRLEAARKDPGSAQRAGSEEMVEHLDYIIKNFEERVADPTMRPYSGEPLSPKASLGEMFNENGLIGSTMDLSAVFKKYGYDGVISDPKWNVPEVVVFDSNQVKSSIAAGFPRANRGTFDETGRLLFQGADEPASVDDIVKVLFQDAEEVPVFYSKLIETTKEMPRRMLVGDYEKWLYKRGVKEAEVNSTNLDIYLNELTSKGEKFVVKADVEKFLKENQIEVEVVNSYRMNALEERVLTPKQEAERLRLYTAAEKAQGTFYDLNGITDTHVFGMTNALFLEPADVLTDLFRGVRRSLEGASFLGEILLKSESPAVSDLGKYLDVQDLWESWSGRVVKLLPSEDNALVARIDKGMEVLETILEVMTKERAEFGNRQSGFGHGLMDMMDTVTSNIGRLQRSRPNAVKYQKLIESPEYKEVQATKNARDEFAYPDGAGGLGPKHQGWVQAGYEDYQEFRIRWKNSKGDLSGLPQHYEEDTLAHARITTRLTPDGKRVMMLDELQSDWMQHGRKYGFNEDEYADKLQDALDAAHKAESNHGYVDALVDAKRYQLDDPLNEDLVDDLDSAIVWAAEALDMSEDVLRAKSSTELQILMSRTHRVKSLAIAAYDDIRYKTHAPEAPFKATSAWLTLLMKPLMKKAADEGYDAVAITPGAWTERVGMPEDAANAFYGVPARSQADYAREVVDYFHFPSIEKSPRITKVFNNKMVEAILRSPEKLLASKNSWDEFGGSNADWLDHAKAWYEGKIPKTTGGFTPKTTGFEGKTLTQKVNALLDVYDQKFVEDIAVEAYEEIRNGKGLIDSVFLRTDPLPLPYEGTKGIVPNVLKKYTKGKIYTGRVKSGDEAEAFESVMMMDLTDKVKARVGKFQLPLFQKPDKNLPPKAGVSFVQDNKAILHAFTQPDVSSLLHEIGHVFRRDLRRSGPQGRIDNDILQKAFGVEVLDADRIGWAHEGRTAAQIARAGQRGAKDKQAPEWSGAAEWPVEAEERLARAWEKYLATGKSPSLELDGVFKKFKSWMTEIYVKIRGSAIGRDVPKEVREVFDRMLTGAMTTEGYMGFTAPQLRKLLLERGLKPAKYDGTKGRPVKLDFAKSLARSDAGKTSEYTRFIDAEAARAKNAKKSAAKLVPSVYKAVKALEKDMKPIIKSNTKVRQEVKSNDASMKKHRQTIRDARRKIILAKAVEVNEASKSAYKTSSKAWSKLLKVEDKSEKALGKHITALTKKWDSSQYVEKKLVPALDGAVEDLKVLIDLLQKEKIRPPRRNLLQHPIAKSTVYNRKSGTWEIDPEAFAEAIDKFYVKGTFEKFIETSSGPYLEPLLKAAQDGTKMVSQTKAQMDGVRKGLASMEDLYRQGVLSTAAWGQAHQIQNTFRTKKFTTMRIPIPFSDMVRAEGILIKDQIGATQFFWSKYKLFDPDYTSFGAMAKPLAVIAGKHQRYLEQGMGDFHNVNQQHLGGDFMDAHINLLDSNVAQKGRYGITITNTMGDGIFQEGRKFILGNLARDDNGKIMFGEGDQGSYLESLVQSLERIYLARPEIRTAPKVTEKAAGANRNKMLEILAKDGMTYRRFLEEFREAVGGSPGLRQSARGITMASRALLDASAMQHTIAAMANAKYGVLTRGEGLQLSRWLSGEIKSIDDVDALWRAAQKTGMDLGEATLRPSTGPDQGQKTIIKDIIKWNLDDGVKATPEEVAAHNQRIADKLGSTLTEDEIKGLQAVKGTRVTDPRQVFMPSHLISTMRDGNVKYVKELDTLYSAPKSINPTKALQTLSRLWKGSVTSGLLLPRPKYYVNNIVGDLSQIWLHHGLITATKVSTQNIFTNIPYVGPRIQNVLSEMSSKLEGVPVLGSAINAVFDPTIGKIFSAIEGPVKVGDETVSVATVRENLALDGVLDTFTSRELEANIHQAGQALADMEAQAARRAGRSLSSRAKEKLVQKLTYDVNAFSTQVQQRQRVGLYLELRRQGLTHEQAVADVKDALYDWSRGFAKWETHYVMGFLSPFYRFWKLATKQMIQTLMEPFVMDSNEYMLKALTGRTRLARAKNQSRILAGIPGWVAQTQADAANEEDSADVFYRSKMSKQWWMKPGGTYWGEVMDQKASEFYLTEHGKRVDVTSYTMSSPATAAEMLSLAMFTLMTPLAALKAATHEDEIFNTVRASAQLNKYAVELGGPLVAAFIENDPSYQGEFKRINAGQEKMLNLLAPGFANVHYDKQHRKVANSTAVAILDLLPVLGTHIPDAVHGWDISRATYGDEETAKRLMSAVLHVTGPVREYAVNSKDQRFYGARDVETLINSAAANHGVGVSAKETWVRPEELD